MRRIDLIVIHCSATREDRPYPVRWLIADHQKRFGRSGYHYYITRDGHVYQTLNENIIGAHARNYNKYSIGVCYEGGLLANGREADTRTPEQKAALLKVLKTLKVRYPDAKILGHCELPYVDKRCPCFLASKEYASI